MILQYIFCHYLPKLKLSIFFMLWKIAVLITLREQSFPFVGPLLRYCVHCCLRTIFYILWSIAEFLCSLLSKSCLLPALLEVLN